MGSPINTNSPTTNTPTEVTPTTTPPVLPIAPITGKGHHGGGGGIDTVQEELDQEELQREILQKQQAASLVQQQIIKGEGTAPDKSAIRALKNRPNAI